MTCHPEFVSDAAGDKFRSPRTAKRSLLAVYGALRVMAFGQSSGQPLAVDSSAPPKIPT